MIILLYLITRFLTQLDMRFSEKNQNLFKIFQILDYNSANYFNIECSYLKNFLNHYMYFNINELKLSSEFISAKSLLNHKNICQFNLNLITDTLKQLPEAFSETLKIIQIINTLPISTASNERFFSSLKRVKSYLRSSMCDERLSDLMIINVEKENASKIDLNEAVSAFSKIKTRRYILE